MALLKCKQCGGQVSSDAKICPHCGTKNFKSASIAGAIVGLLIFALLIRAWNEDKRNNEAKEHARTAEEVRVASLSTQQRTAEEQGKQKQAAHEQAEDDRSESYGACMELVKRNLNDPGSADFDEVKTWHVSRRKDGAFIVTLGLRAKNAFNATIHTQFGCVVKKKNGQWQGLNVSEIK
jgi:predicted  nucleic acid-binding Zn-ribbon protein